jgi:hypothetical protein
MFLCNKNERNAKNGKNESGIVIVEAAIYMPLLMLAFFAFIMVSLYVTQRVVLDSAVSKVCVEASAFLSDEPKHTVANSFSGRHEKIYANPYRSFFTSDYRSYGNRTNFNNAIQEKVRQEAALSFIAGRRGVGQINVKTEYKDHFFFGELIIYAEQTIIFPINVARFGLPAGLTFRTSAKSMVLKAERIVNDIDFIFDGLRYFGIFEIGKVKDGLEDMPGNANEWVNKAMGSGSKDNDNPGEDTEGED